ncbi:MAG: hypothetical protein JW771_01895 [Candidatus Thermoplasmatota archaeon]|nr:hypothetical protein [Candidatus Thermoplasmatota archaeon]
MKSSLFHRIVIGMIFICILAAFSISAASEQAQLSITQKDPKEGKTIGTGLQTAIYYDITVTLYNAGNVTSPQITVGIQDEADGMWTNRTGTVAAKDSKEFLFNDWPIMGPGDHTVVITYRPTNESIARTSFNSGSDTLVLSVTAVEDETEGTPGFELAVLLSALFFILVLKKRE